MGREMEKAKYKFSSEKCNGTKYSSQRKRIIFLGTNGWYDTGTGNTTCILIETKREFIILDAGNGLYKIGRYIRTRKPIYLFLSHFHFDHIVGFHTLNKFNFSQGIDIYGPPGIRKYLTTIIAKPYTVPIKQLKTKIRLNELNRRAPSINVKFRKLVHPTVCYGFRFILEDKIISYCSDTGVCDNLFLLAKDADLLITECSHKSGYEDKNWPHLNPESAAYVAKESRAKKLVLVHFDASLYLTMNDRNDAEIQAKKIFKNTFVAVDNTEIEI